MHLHAQKGSGNCPEPSQEGDIMVPRMRLKGKKRAEQGDDDAGCRRRTKAKRTNGPSTPVVGAGGTVSFTATSQSLAHWVAK